MTPRRKPGWIPVIILLLVAAMPARAQYPTSTISGTVRTEEGKPVADTRIQWIQHGHPITLLTDAIGGFCYYFVEPGRRILSFEHSSTSEAGRYEALINPGALLHLTVVLHDGAGDGSGSAYWEVEKQVIEVQDVWQPERVLTARQIESLPSAEHLWSFLNQTEPSVVADRYDISGMNSQRQLLLGVRGSSWTQNQASLNGLTVTHPSGDGMLAFPDMTAMEAIIYSVGDSQTRHTGSGAHLALIPKSGERELHGQAQFFFQSGALQNTNPTTRYRFFGITESDERWCHFVNGGVQLGSPVRNSPWSYFGSISVRDLEKHIRNHPLPVSGDVRQETFNLSGQLSPRNQVGFYGSAQQLHDPQAGSSPQITRESSIDQRQAYQALQGAWTRYLSPKSLLDTRFGWTHGNVESQFQPGAQGQSREDLFPGYALLGLPNSPSPWSMVEMLSNTRRGPAPLAISSGAGSFEGSAIYSTVRKGLWDTSQRLSIGADYHRMSLTQRYSAINGVNLLFFEGAPNSVRILNTPAHTRDQIGQLELHASDSLSLRRLTLTVRASLDSSQGRNLLSSGQCANALRWTNLAGRFGAAYQVLNRHPLVVRAGLAEIYDQPIAGIWTAVNAEGFGVRLYSWDDTNGDRQFQEGENKQILKVYGSPYTGLDPRLKNPNTSEVTFEITQGGLSGLTFHVFGFRRRERSLMSLVNEGVPFSAYLPEQVLDPGPDGTVGTVDDTTVSVFNQKPESLGHDHYLLTNRYGLRGSSEGLELKISFSSTRFQAEAAMTRYRAVAATAPGISARDNDTSVLLGVFDDPNKAILARGSTFFDRGTLGRLWASSRLCWNVRASLIVSYQDGLPYSRYLPVAGLNQGVVGVLTSQRGPGAAGSLGGPMTAHYANADVRLMKDFSVGAGKLVAVVDVFNLANSAQPLVQADVTAPTQYWRIPLRFETPRSLQLGIGYKW